MFFIDIFDRNIYDKFNKYKGFLKEVIYEAGSRFFSKTIPY